MARKNGNGEGSRPRKRPDERWEARYWSEGRRQSVYGKTRKEAAEKLTKAMAAEEEPPAFVPPNLTVGEFLVQYEDAVRDTMKRRSFETYLDIARLHLLPSFRDTKLKDLTREQVQRMYARKRDEGLSAARVRRIQRWYSRIGRASPSTPRTCSLVRSSPCSNVQVCQTPPFMPRLVTPAAAFS